MEAKPQLVRYNVHLTEAQLRELRRINKVRGVRPAEQIRRAIDAYLAKRDTPIRVEPEEGR